MAERQLQVVDDANPKRTPGQIMEQVITRGDLAALTAEQRGKYYVAVCTSMGLNPLTKPFDYLVLNGKMVLYPTRGTTDQLRGIHRITPQILSREQVGDIYIVHVRVTAPDGRSDEDLGIVVTKGLSGQDLGNAIMKAVTKAKRRATLSLLGLGMPDETEVETIRGARVVPADADLTAMAEGEPEAESEPDPEPEPEAQAEAVDEEWESRKRRFFAIGASHGWSDAALKLFALSSYPYHDRVRTASRNQLTADELRELGDLIDKVKPDIDRETGVIVPAVLVIFANDIANAPDQKTLAEIARRWKSEGHTAAWINTMWKYRNREVPAVSATLIDAEPMADGESGDDRFTA